MGVTFTVATGVCDCCGLSFDPLDTSAYAIIAPMNLYLCTAKQCSTKWATAMLTTGTTAITTAHTTLIVGGVIPNHP